MTKRAQKRNRMWDWVRQKFAVRNKKIELRDRVKSADERILALEDEVAALDERILALEAEVAALRDRTKQDDDQALVREVVMRIGELVEKVEVTARPKAMEQFLAAFKQRDKLIGQIEQRVTDLERQAARQADRPAAAADRREHSRRRS